MPAGMHGGIFLAILADLFGLGGIGKAGLLLDRQPVHIGAQQDQRAVAVLQNADNTGLADARRHGEPDCLEFGGHLGGSAVFEEAHLGVCMEIKEQRGERAVIIRLDRSPCLGRFGQRRLGSKAKRNCAGGGGGGVEQAHQTISPGV
jgi:hypothetical protein